MMYPLALEMPGLTEMIIIGAFGLLLFGKRLPEVGRSLGKSIVEFKKGLKGLEDDIDVSSSERPFRFDPYTGQPIDPNTPQPPASV